MTVIGFGVPDDEREATVDWDKGPVMLEPLRRVGGEGACARDGIDIDFVADIDRCDLVGRLPPRSVVLNVGGVERGDAVVLLSVGGSSEDVKISAQIVKRNRDRCPPVGRGVVVEKLGHRCRYRHRRLLSASGVFIHGKEYRQYRLMSTFLM